MVRMKKFTTRLWDFVLKCSENELDFEFWGWKKFRKLLVLFASWIWILIILINNKNHLIYIVSVFLIHVINFYVSTFQIIGFFMKNWRRNNIIDWPFVTIYQVQTNVFFISAKMAPHEIVHLQSLLEAYHREKNLIRQNFENKQQTIIRAIQATRNGDEAGNLFRELRRVNQEMDRELQRINQKLNEIRTEISQKCW